MQENCAPTIRHRQGHLVDFLAGLDGMSGSEVYENEQVVCQSYLTTILLV